MDGKRDLMSLSDYVFQRTRERLVGLTDGEYFWEPVAGCWSVRLGPDGKLAVDLQPEAPPPPFTTIAWRLWHLIDCYGADRNEQWLLGSDDGQEEARCAPRPNAAEALLALDAAAAWWRQIVTRLDEEDLSQTLGPAAGPYAEEDKAAYVLHQLDEMIHHGAELALMRDLYAGTVGV